MEPYISRYFLAILFVSPLLYASQKYCYSVELWSVREHVFYAKENDNKKPINSSCKIFHIGDYYSQRCGCFDRVRDVKGLEIYKKRYKGAYITKTKRSRFYCDNIDPHKESSSTPLKDLTPQVDSEKQPYKSYEVVQNRLMPNLTDKHFVQSKQDQLRFDLEKYKENTLKKYDTKTEDPSLLSGLHLLGGYSQYVAQSYKNREYTDYEYTIALEYNLLKDGYLDEKKKLQSEYKKSQVVTYQDLVNLEKSSYDENLLKLENLSAYVDYTYYKKLVQYYKIKLVHLKEAFEDGILLKYDRSSLEHKLSYYSSLVALDENDKRVQKVDKRYLNFLKELHKIEIVPFENLLSLTRQNNTQLKLQQKKSLLYEDQSKFYDEIALNLFTQRKELDETGWYTTVGFNADIPLSTQYKKTKSLNRLQKRAQLLKKEALMHSFESRLEYLYSRFIKMKKSFSIYEENKKNLLLELDDFYTIAKHHIPNLKLNYERSIISTEEEIVAMDYEMLTQKVEMLQLLLEMAYITNVESIDKLIVKKV